MSDPTYRFQVPIRTGSGLNARLHWAVRAKRTKVEHLAVAVSMGGWFKPVLPAAVLLTRVSPGTRPMDDDNLAGSLKGIRDAVAKRMGVDDGKRELIRFSYAQERGPWGVRIEIRTA